MYMQSYILDTYNTCVKKNMERTVEETTSTYKRNAKASSEQNIHKA